MSGVAPPVSARKKAKQAVGSSPGAGSNTEATPPKTPNPNAQDPNQGISFSFHLRVADKHVQLQKSAYGKKDYVPETNNFRTLMNQLLSAMVDNGMLAAHFKYKTKPGMHFAHPDAKVANEMYKYYPGHGNHKDIGEVTLPAARFVAKTKAYIDKHAKVETPPGSGNLHSWVNIIRYFELPEETGDDPIEYDTIDAFIQRINQVKSPPPPEDDDEEDGAPSEWRESVDDAITTLKSEVLALRAQIDGLVAAQPAQKAIVAIE